MTYLALMNAATASADQAVIAYSALRQLETVRHMCYLTHVDAPSHFSPDGVNVDRIPIVDSPGIDTGSSTGFPVRHRWLGSGRYAVEVLAGLSSLPAAGAVAVIGVIPSENGTGGPRRVIAAW